tara:strand:+ start:2050 stop:2181 length:132 start_codon:yes stop_codon:yes gene_type:complete
MIKNLVDCAVSGAIGITFLGLIGISMLQEHIRDRKNGLVSFDD